MPDQPLWAVVPAKDSRDAKQRLSAVLAQHERDGLFLAMLEDVLEALAATPGLAGRLVVTRDPKIADLARSYQCRVVTERENAGHTAAVTFAATTLATEGAVGFITIPGDVPLVQPDDIAAVLAAHGDAPAITICPARDELGSNAVACSPPDVMPLRFGDNSFYPHLETARSRGIEPTVVERARIGLDVDTPADLLAFVQSPSEARAYSFLAEHGIIDRLSEPVANQN